MSSQPKLNLATKEFEENRRHGLMICGINWGGDPSNESAPEEQSFFSDKTVNNYPYRNRLLRWFNFWGDPLQIDRGREGWLERSIAQTNWLPDQDVSMRNRNTFEECLRLRTNFLFHVESLRPRLILFCGTILIHVLNNPQCLEEAKTLLGQPSKLVILRKDIFEDGRKLKRFAVGVQKFEHCEIVAVPHPTGSIGLSDAYIAAFKTEVSEVMDRYRQNACAEQSAPGDAKIGASEL